MVERWVLNIELDGEWEECCFETRHDALSAFMALVRDYSERVRRAILVSPRINKTRDLDCDRSADIV